MKNLLLKFIYFIVGFLRWCTLTKDQRKKLNKALDKLPDNKFPDHIPTEEQTRKLFSAPRRNECVKTLYTKKHTRGRAKKLQKVFTFDEITNKVFTRYISHY